MELVLGLVCLYIGLMLGSLFWCFKKNDFLAKDADRCLNRFCEVEEDTIREYQLQGYLYTKGLAVIEENGKKRFIKQSKIVWLEPDC